MSPRMTGLAVTGTLFEAALVGALFALLDPPTALFVSSSQLAGLLLLGWALTHAGGEPLG